MRGIVKYPGSKWNIASKLVNLIPEHHSYLEPFFGSGAILFTKSPSRIETINDRNGDVVNLFQCIQDDPERLARLVMTTPYSREAYDVACQTQAEEDPYKRALQFLIRNCQGFGYRANGQKVGWKNDIQGRERAYALLNWYHLPEQVVEMAERLRKVQIENRPALELIPRFNYENVFMYLDPPYLLQTRVGKRKQYQYEMTDDEHEELLKTILRSKAKIMISGYDSELYNDYLSGWERQQFMSCAEKGSPRVETVWLNYKTEKQIEFSDLFTDANFLA